MPPTPASKIFARFRKRIAQSDEESVPGEQWELQKEILAALKTQAPLTLTFNRSDKNPLTVSVFPDQDVALLVADVGRRKDGRSHLLRGDEYRVFVNGHQAVKAIRSFFRTIESLNSTLLLFVSGDSGNTRLAKNGQWCRDSHTGVLAIWKDSSNQFVFRQFDPNPGTDATLLPMSKDIITQLQSDTVLVHVTDGDNYGSGACFRLAVEFIFECLKGERGPRGGDVARIFNMKTKKWM